MRSHRPAEQAEQPEVVDGDHVAYLAGVHLDHLSRLADHLVQAIDDHHEARDMLPGTHRLRSDLIETLDRLDEARRRGPGRP